MSEISIITVPTVHVLGRQEFDQSGLDAFLADHGISWDSDTGIAAEKLVETAGRVCYMSFAKPRPGGNEAYINHILEVGHGSVLEHAVWNLLITGVSRSLSHELVRHRVGVSPSQMSQRYVDESVAEYVLPAIIDGDCIAGNIWIGAIEHAHQAYIRLVERLTDVINKDPLYADLSATDKRKLARQSARSVLPNATETKLFITANARSLRHLIELRASRHADTEIRALAIAILKVMQVEAPALFGDYVINDLADGTQEATTKNRKV